MSVDDYLANLVDYIRKFCDGLASSTARGVGYPGIPGREVGGIVHRLRLELLIDRSDIDFALVEARRQWVTGLLRGAPELDTPWTTLKWASLPMRGNVLCLDHWRSERGNEIETSRTFYLPAAEVVSWPMQAPVVYPAITIEVYPPEFSEEDRVALWQQLSERALSLDEASVLPAGDVDVRFVIRNPEIFLAIEYPIELRGWPIDWESGIDIRYRVAIPPVGSWRARYLLGDSSAMVEIQPAGSEGWATVARVSAITDGEMTFPIMDGDEMVWRSTFSWATYRGTELITARPPYYYATHPLQREGMSFRDSLEAAPDALRTGEILSPGFILWWDEEAGRTWLVRV